jgi:hypothetical protein
MSTLQEIKVVRQLVALPYDALTLRMTTKLLNDRSSAGATPLQRFQFFAGERPHDDAVVIPRYWVHRKVGPAKTSAGGVHFASNVAAHAVQHALHLGKVIAEASGDSEYTLEAAVVAAEGDDAIVVVPSSGKRAVRALQLGQQSNVVVYADGSHCLVSSSSKTLLTSILTRFCGVIVPLAFIIHQAKSAAFYEAALRKVESILNVSGLEKLVAFMTDNDAALRQSLRAVYDERVLIAQCVWHAFVNAREQYGAHLQRLAARSDKDGTLKVVKKYKNGRFDYAFVDHTSMSRAALFRCYVDLEKLRGDATDDTIAKRITLADAMSPAELASAINNIVSNRQRQFLDGAPPKVPKSTKSASIAKKAAVARASDAVAATDAATTAAAATAATAAAETTSVPRDRQSQLERLADVDESGKKCVKDSLLPLLYAVVHSPTTHELSVNLRALKVAALFSGMASWVYDYLLVGILHPDRIGEIVFAFTNKYLDGDHTNNSAEQLHAMYCDGALLKNREQKAGIVDLVDSLVEFANVSTSDNLAKAVGASSDSSPYTRTVTKVNKLARETDDLKVLEWTEQTEVGTQVVEHFVKVAGKSGFQHTVVLQPFARCDCWAFATNRICRHVVFLERKHNVSPPPFRTSALDAYHKSLMQFVAVGSGSVEVDGLTPASVQLPPAPTVGSSVDDFAIGDGGMSIDDDVVNAATSAAATSATSSAPATSATSSVMTDDAAKLSNFLFGNLSAHELRRFAEHIDEHSAAPPPVALKLLEKAIPAAKQPRSIKKSKQTARVKK